MNYSEKLKDPRWQKKRLEILKRDKFTCKYCRDKETELQVHHLKYSGEPWEAENKNMITLCKDCHLLIEYYKKVVIEKIIKVQYQNTITGKNVTTLCVKSVKNERKLIAIVNIEEGKISHSIVIDTKGELIKAINKLCK